MFKRWQLTPRYRLQVNQTSKAKFISSNSEHESPPPIVPMPSTAHRVCCEELEVGSWRQSIIKQHLKQDPYLLVISRPLAIRLSLSVWKLYVISWSKALLLKSLLGIYRVSIYDEDRDFALPDQLSLRIYYSSIFVRDNGILPFSSFNPNAKII